LISLFMMCIPFLTLVRAISIIDSASFRFQTLFYNKEYTHEDVERISISNGFGTKFQMYVVMNDKRKMWITTTFWSNSSFCDLKEYFVKNNPDKVSSLSRFDS
jgi:hypothetical protein